MRNKKFIKGKVADLLQPFLLSEFIFD